MKDSLGLFEKIETSLEGCFEIQPVAREDHRGAFIKTFHSDAFKELGLETILNENYYSISNKNVLRGMHFQTPPNAQMKLVYCVEGEVMDVAIDLRKNSATYGKHHVCYLKEKGKALYIPEGFAHGFLTLTDKAIITYYSNRIYASESDGGILWSSCGIDWKCCSPVLSEKDKKHPTLEEFNSPF